MGQYCISAHIDIYDMQLLMIFTRLSQTD